MNLHPNRNLNFNPNLKSFSPCHMAVALKRRAMRHVVMRHAMMCNGMIRNAMMCNDMMCNDMMCHAVMCADLHLRCCVESLTRTLVWVRPWRSCLRIGLGVGVGVGVALGPWARSGLGDPGHNPST